MLTSSDVTDTRHTATWSEEGVAGQCYVDVIDFAQH